MDDVKDFETKIKRVEEIVSLLERGGIPLSESMRLYEEGIEAVNRCIEMLKSTKMKIVKIGTGGKTEEFTDLSPEKN